MKRVFITGIAGFIGFHLALFLQKKGIPVFGIDNFHPFYDPLFKKERASILQKSGIAVSSLDVNQALSVKALLQKEQVTHVIHLAAQPGVRHPVISDYVQANLEGFASILEVVKSLSIPLIFASSSSVYGKNEKIPFTETDLTENPASFYGATKKANELMAKSFYNTYGIPMVGFRFFTVYGPWGRPDMAYFSFTKKILKGESISLFKEGKLKRDFTYIDDIVPAIYNALTLPPSFEIFNLGHTNPHSVEELVFFLERFLGKKAVVEKIKEDKKEPLITFANCEKAKKLLGFSPIISLEEGISRFVSWYQKSFPAKVFETL